MLCSGNGECEEKDMAEKKISKVRDASVYQIIYSKIAAKPLRPLDTYWTLEKVHGAK